MKLFSRKRKTSRNQKAESPRRVLLKQIFVGILLFSLLAGIITGVWYLTRAQALTIDTVEVIGGETISHDSIIAQTETALTGAYFKLVPKRFVFTYPAEEIEAMVATNPRIKNVHVERQKQTVVVVFEEYRPSALWCQELEATDCLFLDIFGYAFAPAPSLEGASFVRYKTIAQEPAIGQSAFAKEFIERTANFIDVAYTKLGLNIIFVEQTSENELLYHVSGGGVIKVSFLQTAEDTLENLETILTSDAFVHLEPGNFAYIDLRYGNKVFVNEVTEEEKTATSTEAEAVVDEVVR